ncbi:MAG: riboflavin kinase, partial [Bacteroidota bacterium]
VIVPFDASFARLAADEYITDFLISKINPGYIVIGYDHRFGASREGNIDLLRKYAGSHSFEVVEISAEQIDEITVSSSKIRKALDGSEIELANKLLGRPFSFSGTVVHGDHIGRTISFPTAYIPWGSTNLFGSSRLTFAVG